MDGSWSLNDQWLLLGEVLQEGVAHVERVLDDLRCGQGLCVHVYVWSEVHCKFGDGRLR